MMQSKLIWTIYHSIILVGLIGIPVYVLLLPPTHFDQGRSICVSMLLFDTACPGCGLTRASMRLLHFDFYGAWEYNKMVFVVLPIACLLWIEWFKTELRNLDRSVERKISKKISGKFFLFDKLNIFGHKV